MSVSQIKIMKFQNPKINFEYNQIQNTTFMILTTILIFDLHTLLRRLLIAHVVILPSYFSVLPPSRPLLGLLGTRSSLVLNFLT